MITPLLLVKPILMFGLAGWLTIACFNNIVDRSTNRDLLKTMLSMKLLKEDGQLGQGLLGRALVNTNKAHILLWLVVGIQAIISMMMWSASGLLLNSVFNSEHLNFALTVANWALLGFMVLWLWFLCGGIWFGYWIKMNHVQTTHLLLLIAGLLALIVINSPLK